jgi:hypothetical protein
MDIQVMRLAMVTNQMMSSTSQRILAFATSSPNWPSIII